MLRKPFLKWAGGKYRLLDAILKALPPGRRFVEPFAGSCAVYLNSGHKEALVADVNSDLVALYQHVQGEGEEYIRFCQSFFTADNNCRDSFLALRQRFNASSDPGLRAALLLYLNRHAFNGLVRYNARGEFNVPFGRYRRPYFPLKELRDFHTKTREVPATFVTADFREIFARLLPGDVVYCDPPYLPLSATANFTSYAGKVFGRPAQRELASLARAAHEKGIAVLLSNHNTEETRALYAGARILEFTVQRSISCNGAKRNPAPELLAVYYQE